MVLNISVWVIHKVGRKIIDKLTEFSISSSSWAVAWRIINQWLPERNLTKLNFSGILSLNFRIRSPHADWGRKDHSVLSWNKSKVFCKLSNKYHVMVVLWPPSLSLSLFLSLSLSLSCLTTGLWMHETTLCSSNNKENSKVSPLYIFTCAEIVDGVFYKHTHAHTLKHTHTYTPIYTPTLTHKHTHKHSHT